MIFCISSLNRVKFHKIIVRLGMLFEMETVPATSSHAKKLQVTEMKICRWACGHMLRERVINDNIREPLKVEKITERCRKARQRWFVHVKIRYQIRWKTNNGVGTTWEEKRKTEAEMDGLFQPGLESYRGDRR